MLLLFVQKKSFDACGNQRNLFLFLAMEPDVTSVNLISFLNQIFLELVPHTCSYIL